MLIAPNHLFRAAKEYQKNKNTLKQGNNCVMSCIKKEGINSLF